jgi:thioredoxin 1
MGHKRRHSHERKALMNNEIVITEANFEAEVLDSAVPVLVDYWAPWCGPCRQLAPVIEQIAAERAGSLKVCKVNVDDEPHLAHHAGVQGIPFLVLYRDGRAVARAVGAQPKNALEHALGLTPTDVAA